jgi:hypothetical protein
MVSFDVNRMADAIRRELDMAAYLSCQNQARFHELMRCGYYETTRTVCFCSQEPSDSEFAQNILSKRYFHGKMMTTDEAILPLLSSVVGKPPESLLKERENNHSFWDTFSRQLHRVDPSFVFLNVLSQSPVIGGLRNREELKHGVEAGLISCSVWIESDEKLKVKRSKYAISRYDCDFVISRGRTRISRVQKIEKLGKLLYSGTR